ncbi:MAG: TRAM domain-containing protein [Acetobacteraceae bacterium]
MAAPVTIERIGSEGDGIAHLTDGTPVYVRLTLPGEVVSIDLERPRGAGWVARAASIDAPAAQRGQHLAARSDSAVAVCCSIGLILATGTGSAACCAALRRAGSIRRRILPTSPACQASGGGWTSPSGATAARSCSAHAAGSPEVVDLHDCLVLHPTLVALLDPFRAVLPGWARSGARRRWS